MKLTNIVFVVCSENQRKFQRDFLFNISMKEGSVQVHLIYLPIQWASLLEERSYCNHFHEMANISV